MADLVWNGINIPRDGEVPESCTRMQGIVAMGPTLWAQVTALRAGMPWATQIALDEAQIWHRDSPLLLSLANALGLSSDQMDDLFRVAARVEL